jgi:hypothetical protein
VTHRVISNLARQHYDKEDRRAFWFGLLRLIAIPVGALLFIAVGFLPW